MKSFFTQPKTQVAILLSTSVTILGTTGLILLDETRPIVRTWLTNTFTHHWLGKSVLSISLFLALVIILRVLPVRVEERQVSTYIQLLNIVTFFCTAALMVFFAMEAIG